jgi:hypothetical protein
VRGDGVGHALEERIDAERVADFIRHDRQLWWCAHCEQVRRVLECVGWARVVVWVAIGMLEEKLWQKQGSLGFWIVAP